MDTVYNNGSNGPFIQTFKFRKYDLLFCVYQEVKDSIHMLDGILLLENILGKEIFQKEVEVILTDRGSEFVLADRIEAYHDHSRKTRLFYCDAMASWQKGIHILLRDICPKEVDLFKLGFNSQDKANLISSHINSYSKEKLNGKSSFQLLEFLNPNMFDKLIFFGLKPIPPDMVILKPYLIKSNL
ncbi:MAG: transposase [Erysipelotrichaceae bacterium]|nr:transposase [Erysipelotrichaceae bacterium]